MKVAIHRHNMYTGVPMHADIGMVSLQACTHLYTDSSQEDICRDVTDEVRCQELPSVRWKIRALTLPASRTFGLGRSV